MLAQQIQQGSPPKPRPVSYVYHHQHHQLHHYQHPVDYPDMTSSSSFSVSSSTSSALAALSNSRSNLFSSHSSSLSSSSAASSVPSSTASSPPSTSPSPTHANATSIQSSQVTHQSTSSSPPTKKYNRRSFLLLRQEQQEDAITLDEYKEILSAEVWVEVPKLREYARHGIPHKVRGEVWMYLLNLQEADRSKELSTRQQRLLTYESMNKDPTESSKRIRGEISRCQRRIQCTSSRDLPKLMERVVGAFLNQNPMVEYYPAMVDLCAPLVYAVRREHEAYWCFEKMMLMLEDHFNDQNIREGVARFMTLFHTYLPDLYSLFEEEEVDIKEWVASALRFVLSKELVFENALRLWDTYFSVPNWLQDLHPFFCLALLKHLKERFEDLEQSEIGTMLSRLPLLDMDQIINEAFNIRDELLERQIADNSHLHREKKI